MINKGECKVSTLTLEGSNIMFKKKIISLISVASATIIATTMLIACGGGNKGKNNDYEFVQEVEFGYYPQTEVKDNATLSTLNDAAGNLPVYLINPKDGSVLKDEPGKWTLYDYKYVSRLKENNSNETVEYPHDDPTMYYIDIDLDKDGKNDYRGVFIRKQRKNCEQVENGYFYEGYNGNLYSGDGSASGVYWFKYEPITWQVMGESGDNYVLKSKIILDAQPYDFEYFGALTRKGKVNGQIQTIVDYTLTWEKSTIRKWLNATFYDTAFTASDKETIVKSSVDNTTIVKQNDGKVYSEFELYQSSADTEDFVYTPSLKEWIDWYGVTLSPENTLPQKTSHATNISDYGVAQGARAVDKLINAQLSEGYYKKQPVSKRFNYDKGRKFGAVSLRSGNIAVAENGNFSSTGDNDTARLNYINTETSTGVCPMISVKKSSVSLRDAA